MTVPAVREIGTQVVIAGAGPAGLLLACELRRARVPVVIVERLGRPMTESRASQLAALTAELLHERGFGALLDEAAAEPRAHFGGLPFTVSGLDSDYPGSWKVPQYRTEAVLGLRARKRGAILLRAHELTAVRQTADHVTITARGPAGDVRIRARYLAGCDGADSTVRRLCGFTASATAATRELLRADVTGIDIPARRFERLPGGFAAASAQGGVTRVMVHVAGQGAVTRTAPPGFAEVARCWARVTGEDISGGTPVWVDAFSNARGQAGHYRRGRVLLAGDAAHWHLPIGGQALNAGLQDAVNLGWKLAGVVNGWASGRLLDSYHDERHPVAARMLSYVAAQEIVMLGDTGIEPLRAVLAELIGLGQVRDHLARVVSGLDDRYLPGGRDGAAGSPLTGRRLPHVPLRDRHGQAIRAGLLTGTEPFIVRLPPAGAGAEAITLPGGFRLRTIDAMPGDTNPWSGCSAILVRPDGYIAWAGNSDTELKDAIMQWAAAGPAAAQFICRTGRPAASILFLCLLLRWHSRR